VGSFLVLVAGQLGIPVSESRGNGARNQSLKRIQLCVPGIREFAPGWKVFLETREDFRRTIAYIRKNLVQAWRSAQIWPFVKEYDGWLPGQVRVVRPQHEGT
jgi:hypothetical protein